MRSLGLAVICTILFAGAAQASGYQCTVKDAIYSAQGTLLRTDLTKAAVGKEFIVDRSNGRMLGDYASGIGWQPKVLEYGSRQQSFKVIYTSAPYLHVRFLTVQEFDDGTLKSFYMLDEDSFLTGNCKSLD